MNDEINNYTQVVSALPDLGLPRAFLDSAGNSHHPLMLLAVLFYGKAAGFGSEQRIALACGSDASLAYLCSGRKPEGFTLSEFRHRWVREIEAGFRLILEGLRSRGVQRFARLDIPEKFTAQLAQQMLLPDDPPARSTAVGRQTGGLADALAQLTPDEQRNLPRTQQAYDPLRLPDPEPEIRPDPAPAQREQEVAMRKRRRIERIVALLILVTLLGVVTFAYVTRWPLDADGRAAVTEWVASEYAAKELAELKPTWYDASRERLAPQIVSQALAEKGVEVLSISTRGRGDEIAVRIEVAVQGERPGDGRGVRYYSMIRDPDLGWRMHSEMTAISYYTRL